MPRQPIKLEKSFSRLNSVDFKDVLAEELTDLASELPLDQLTHEGGWPDDSSFQCSVRSIKEKSKKVYIEIECFFDVSAPTGCSDISVDSSGGGTLVIIMDRSTKTAALEYGDDD